MYARTDRLASRGAHRSTLKSAVVRLPESPDAEGLVKTMIAVAKRCRGRLRGLTAVDASAHDRSPVGSPEAMQLLAGAERLEGGEARRQDVRMFFSQACVSAGLDFDLRRVTGDAMELLPGESRFHDLFAFTVTDGPRRFEGEIDASDAVRLLIEGTAPTLVLRSGAVSPERALLVVDGSPAGVRASRSFLDQDPFELTVVRVLAIAGDADEAPSILRDQMDAVRRRYPDAESGYLVGSSARLAADYAERWQADLVVVGAKRSPPVLRYFFGETVREILRRTACSLYAAS